MNEILNEKKHDRFKRLAVNRTNKILDMVFLLGNLSNCANYNYKQTEVDQIFSAIRTKLNEAEGRFKNNNNKKRKRFVFVDDESDEESPS